MTEPSAFDGEGGGPGQVVHNGRTVLWAPNPGPQTLLLTCPLPDVFFGGARGGGKTWGLLGDWLQHSMKWGGKARGIFFRKTYRQMDEVIDRSRKLYNATGGIYASSEYTWRWPSGASLRFRYLDKDADADEYHGQEFCVEVGTAVVMADGTQKAVELIEVGDMVLTLEGPRKVTRTVQPYVAPGVEVRVYDESGAEVGIQRQPAWHPVLALSGVRGTASVCSPSASQQADPSSTLPAGTPRESWKRGGPDAPGWISWTGAHRTGCRASSDVFQGGLPPLKLTAPVTLHGPTLQSAIERLSSSRVAPSGSDAPGKSSATSSGTSAERTLALNGLRMPLELERPSLDLCDRQTASDAACAPTSSQTGEGSLAGCLSGPDSRDGRALEGEGSGPEKAPSQADAGAPTPVSLEDGKDTTRTHTPCQGQRTWRHLYSGEERHLSEKVVFGTAVFSPCEDLLVADITVDGANHYITASGLINGQTWQAFDELTNWASPKPVDKLMACLRSAEGVFCVRRSTGNPGGPGTKWVRDRYIKDRVPGEAFDMIPNAQRPGLKMRSVFIPSKLEDNPKLHIDDPTYEARLALSTFGDDALWKAWREGDWDVLVGRYFERFNEADNVYDPGTVELAPWMPKWISVDWGYEHPSAVYWYTWDGSSIWVHRELVRAKMTPVQLAYEIAGMTFGETVDAVYLSPDAFGRKMSERTIAQEMSDVFRTFNIPDPSQADHDRVGGAMLLQQMFGEKRLMISRDCPKLIECIPMCQRDTGDGGNPEDVDKFDGDDPYDSLRYGVKTRPGAVRIPDEVLLARRINKDADPQSRYMQMRVAKAELNTKHAAIVSARRSGNWRREMAAN